MNIFYFGSVCSNESFLHNVQLSKRKPSQSAQNFETAFIHGLLETNRCKLTVASAESIATWPDSRRIFLKKRIDKCYGQDINILSTLNLPFFKQLLLKQHASKMLKKWLINNRDNKNKCVVTYSIYPVICSKFIKLCRKFKCPTIAIIADAPSTMYTYSKIRNPIKKFYAIRNRKKAVKLQNSFDGYIYLTEYLASAISDKKPYLVTEAIVDSVLVSKYSKINKKQDAIMYAGMLHKKYGVDLLLESFELMKSNCELWLFGSGDMDDIIVERAKSNPKIKFFGRVDRDIVLGKETEASILINLRNPNDEYTKLSFPSKIVEYMLSGTPVISTNLLGIPDEYKKHLYIVEYGDANSIASSISSIMLQRENFKEKGNEARKFVIDNKTSSSQGNRILDFLDLNFNNENRSN